MKRSITLSVFASFGMLAWSQAAPKPSTQTQRSTPPSAASTPSSPDLKARGPEATAAKDPNKVVATINGKPFTAKQAVEMLNLIPETQRRSAPNLEKVFEQLYMISDLAGKAQQEHLDQQSPTKEQLEIGRDNILAQAYMTHLTNASSQPTQDPKQYYDTHQDEFDIAKLSGIVIAFNPPGTPASSSSINRTEQEAQQKAADVEKKIKAGADVATLSRTESDDQRSAGRGGDMGTLAAGTPNVPVDLKNIVFNKLKPGEVSEPIRLPSGFYILKLDSRTKQTFEQAKPEIAQKLQAEKNQALVKEQLDKYKIQVQDPDFFATSSTSAVKIPSLANGSSNAAGPAARR
ncbi:MAG: peptidylprolyl isomerase [Acidobacteriota bacterium]|nr:peptidylprolyl isomerase [Acidobacteriota bacterium]